MERTRQSSTTSESLGWLIDDVLLTATVGSGDDRHLAISCKSNVQVSAPYEPDAFKPNLTSAEADIRIAMLTAKLKLLGEPPHTL
jgi:hypothetical protein